MTIYANETHEEERAFYGIKDAKIINCNLSITHIYQQGGIYYAGLSFIDIPDTVPHK